MVKYYYVARVSSRDKPKILAELQALGAKAVVPEKGGTCAGRRLVPRLALGQRALFFAAVLSGTHNSCLPIDDWH